jgi:hypothetical protein
VITGIENMTILDQAFAAVQSFKPLEPAQVKELLARTAQPASKGEFEQFKTSNKYDGTIQNPDWLGLKAA